MAATAEERREAQVWFENQAARNDSAFEEIFKPGMRAKWEKPDGRVVMLPTDPYHFRLYMKRGFTLASPSAPVGPASVSMIPVAEDASGAYPQRAAPAEPAEDASGAPPELVAPPLGHWHKHRFDGNRVGAPCKTVHCEARRKKAKRKL